jgi:hypothetical protein
MPYSANNPVSFWKKTPTITLFAVHITDRFFVISLWLGSYGLLPGQVIQIFFLKYFRLLHLAGFMGRYLRFRLPVFGSHTGLGCAGNCRSSFKAYSASVVSPQILGVTRVLLRGCPGNRI